MRISYFCARPSLLQPGRCVGVVTRKVNSKISSAASLVSSSVSLVPRILPYTPSRNFPGVHAFLGFRGFGVCVDRHTRVQRFHENDSIGLLNACIHPICGMAEEGGLEFQVRNKMGHTKLCTHGVKAGGQVSFARASDQR